jgi:hypothetical protein
MLYVFYDPDGKITSTIMSEDNLDIAEPHLVFDADSTSVASMLANCWGSIKVDIANSTLIIDPGVDKDYIIQEAFSSLITSSLLPTKQNISILEKQVDFLIKVVLGLIDQNTDQTYVDALRQVDQHSSLTGRDTTALLDSVVEGKAYLRKILNILRDRETTHAPNKAPAKTRLLWYLNDNKELLAKHQLNNLLSFLLESTPESTGNELKTMADGVAQQMSQP